MDVGFWRRPCPRRAFNVTVRAVSWLSNDVSEPSQPLVTWFVKRQSKSRPYTITGLSSLAGKPSVSSTDHSAWRQHSLHPFSPTLTVLPVCLTVQPSIDKLGPPTCKLECHMNTKP